MGMNNGGPAFPGEKSVRFGQTNDCNEGMSLRDYFAAKAIAIAWDAYDKGYCGKNGDELQANELAEHPYQIADAMLSAREKT